MDKKQIIFLILFFLLLLDRFLIFSQFSIKYTDIDQMIFWLAADDYASFIFKEPYFYGQAYYPMLSPLLSIPLVFSGVKPYIALAIISNFIAVFPFLLLATMLFRGKYHISSFWVLLVPLLLPMEYGLITGMSRGFFQGIFCCSLLAIPLISPNNKSTFPYLFSSIGLGYFMNTNSVILSFLVAVYIWLYHYKNPSFYILGIIFFMPFVLLKYLLGLFYKIHPEYVVHDAPNMIFDLAFLKKSFYKLDNFYNHLNPIFWNIEGGVLFFILITSIILFFIQKKKKEGVSLFSVFILLIFSMGITKTHDGADSIFYSSSRMYLSLSYIFAVAFFWLTKYYKNNSLSIFAPLIIGICFFTYKTIKYPDAIQASLNRDFPITNIQELKEKCEHFQKEMDSLNVNFVVFAHEKNWDNEFINYALPIFLEKKKPITLMKVTDRRTTHFFESKSSIYKNIWLKGIRGVNLSQINNYTFINNDPTSIIIRNNNLPLGDLMDSLNVPISRKYIKK